MIIYKNRYVLRQAAGAYWILDTGQEGVPYKGPLCINEMGAMIYELLAEGRSQAEISEYIAREYETDIEEVSGDVDSYIKMLGIKGVL